MSCGRACFNPRPHVGGDVRGQGFWRRFKVSIHAPTWGATAAPCSRRKVFMFQSTPPRGGRLSRFCILIFNASFNPRPHVGDDRQMLPRLYFKPVSIHAPTWGTTHGVSVALGRSTFQSTPPRGGRPNHFNPLNIRAMKHVLCEPTGEGKPQNSWKHPNVLTISGCECAWSLCITPCSHSEDNGFVHIV